MGRGLDGLLLSYPLGLVQFSSSTGAGGLARFPVAHSERETPLPIPNRAVKPFSADGTWGATPWESRSPPVFTYSFEPDPAGRARSVLGCPFCLRRLRTASFMPICRRKLPSRRSYSAGLTFHSWVWSALGTR